MSFVDILAEIAPCRNFRQQFAIHITELNCTLKAKGLPTIPTGLNGLAMTLSHGKDYHMTRNALLARYNIPIPPDFSQEPKGSTNTDTTSPEKYSHRMGRPVIPLEVKQQAFKEAMDIPFGQPKKTLRGVLTEIIGINRGFWGEFFPALEELNMVLKKQGKRVIPLTQAGLAVFIFGKITVTREEFVTWVAPILSIALPKNSEKSEDREKSS